MIPDPDQDETAEGPERCQWERQPDDTPNSFAAFARYRDLGPVRSLRKAGALHYHEATDPKTVTHTELNNLKRWSTGHGWVARAEAWDDYLDAVSRAEQVEAVREMNRVHAAVGRDMLVPVQAALRKLADDPEAKLTPMEIARLGEASVKIERLARGEASQVTAAAPRIDDAHEAAKERAKDLVDELEAARARKTGTAGEA